MAEPNTEGTELGSSCRKTGRGTQKVWSSELDLNPEPSEHEELLKKHSVPECKVLLLCHPINMFKEHHFKYLILF
jgi:hypothetical protein